jgi:hypothetical protein
LVNGVRLGGIEERHPLVVGAADQADAVLDVDRIAVVGAQAHAAQADRRDLQGAQLSLVHDLPFMSRTGCASGSGA